MATDPAKRMDPLWVTDAGAQRVRLEGGPDGTIRARVFALTVGEGTDGEPVVIHLGIQEEHWASFAAAFANVSDD